MKTIDTDGTTKPFNIYKKMADVNTNTEKPNADLTKLSDDSDSGEDELFGYLNKKAKVKPKVTAKVDLTSDESVTNNKSNSLKAGSSTFTDQLAKNDTKSSVLSSKQNSKQSQLNETEIRNIEVTPHITGSKKANYFTQQKEEESLTLTNTIGCNTDIDLNKDEQIWDRSLKSVNNKNKVKEGSCRTNDDSRISNVKFPNRKKNNKETKVTAVSGRLSESESEDLFTAQRHDEYIQTLSRFRICNSQDLNGIESDNTEDFARNDIIHVQDRYSNLSDSSPVKLEVSLIELDVSPISSPTNTVIENKGNNLSPQNIAETNHAFVPTVNKGSHIPTQYKFVRDGNKLARVAVVQQCHVPDHVEFDGLYDHPVLSEMKVERVWKETDLQLSDMDSVQAAKLSNTKTTETIKRYGCQRSDIESTEKNYEQGLSGKDCKIDDPLLILSKSGIETTKSSFQQLSFKTDVKSRTSKETVPAGKTDYVSLSKGQDNSELVSNQANVEATENYVHQFQGQIDNEYFLNQNNQSLSKPVHDDNQLNESSVNVKAFDSDENMSVVTANETETESTSRSWRNLELDPECSTSDNTKQPINKAAEITTSPCDNKGNVDHETSIVKKTDTDFVEYLENTCLSENASTCSRVSLCSSESPIVLKVSADGRLIECTQCPASVGSEEQILRERKTEMDINFLTRRILKLESEVIEMKKATGDGQMDQSNFVEKSEANNEKQTTDVSHMNYVAKKRTDIETESAEIVNFKTDAVVDTSDSDVKQASRDNHSHQSIEKADSDLMNSSEKVKQGRKRKKPDSNNVDQPIEKHKKSMTDKGDDTVKTLETLNSSCLKGKKRRLTTDSKTVALAKAAKIVTASKAKSSQIQKCPNTVDNPETTACNKLVSHKTHGKNHSPNVHTYDVGVHKETVMKALPTSINFGKSLCEDSQMETDDFMNYDEDNLEKLYQLKLAEVKNIQNALKQKKKENNTKRKPNKNVSKSKKTNSKEANDTSTTETTLGDKVEKIIGGDSILSSIKNLSKKESQDNVSSKTSPRKKLSGIERTKKTPLQATVRKKKQVDIKTAKARLVSNEKDEETIANKSPKKSKLSSNMVRNSGRRKTSKPKVNKKVTWNKKESELLGDQPQTICDSKESSDIMEASNNVREKTNDSVVKNNLRKGKTPSNRKSKGRSVSNLTTDVNKTSNASEVKEANGSKLCKQVNLKGSLCCVKNENCIEKKGRKRKTSTVCKCCSTSNETSHDEKQMIDTNYPVTNEELDVACNEKLVEKEISSRSPEKCKNMESKKQRLEAIISEKLKCVKSTEMKSNIEENKTHERQKKTSKERGKPSSVYNKRLNKNKLKASKTIKSKEKLRDKKQAQSPSKVDSPLSDTEKKTMKNANNAVAKSNNSDLKKGLKKKGRKLKLSKFKMVGSVQASRMAFEKSYDYSWKDKLGTDAFSMNLINQQQVKKKPLDVKKMIKKILVSPESSDIKMVSHRSTKHRRKHVDGKHSMTEVVEIICSDSDDAWLSDSSVSFPGIRLGDTGENTQVHRVTKLHASGQATDLDIETKQSQTEPDKVTKLGLTGIEYHQPESAKTLEESHSDIETNKKTTGKLNIPENLTEVDDSVSERESPGAQGSSVIIGVSSKPFSEAKLNETSVENVIKQGGKAVQFRSETITYVEVNNQVHDENQEFKSVCKSAISSCNPEFSNRSAMKGNLINTGKTEAAKNVVKKTNCIELHCSPSKAEQLEIQTGSNSDSYYTDSDSEHKKVYVISQKSPVSPKVSKTFTQIKSLLGRRERKIPGNSAIQNLQFISD